MNCNEKKIVLFLFLWTGLFYKSENLKKWFYIPSFFFY